MKEVASEIIKKINERNIVWIALAFSLSIILILIFSSYFIAFVRILENSGVPTPYSKVMILILDISLCILFMNPIASFLQRRKKEEKWRLLIKNLDKLSEDEHYLLLSFAVRQENTLFIKASDVHVARLLKKKGFLTTSWNLGKYEGGEDFYMPDILLEYLTEKFHDEINVVRRDHYK